MREKLTPHLHKIVHQSGIASQYLSSPYEEKGEQYNDPLMEDAHEVVKGLIHKYKNRALIKVSYLCAAHCRFCTRIRQIGNEEGTLTEKDIMNITDYLYQHTEIEDVILSGGDPFITPNITELLLHKIQDIDSVKVIRIGTRLPLQSPKSFDSKTILKLLGLINNISQRKPFYILLHMEHPNELTEESLKAIQTIKQQTAAMLLSQTVFLKGINIDFDILHALFEQLYFAGVTPYYIYHCDNVKGLERFIGDIEVEKKIMVKLKNTLSGVACPTFIADLENEYGKYPFDLNIINTTDNKVHKI